LFGSRKPKIKVGIINQNGDISYKKYPIEGERVVIKPKKRGRGGLGWTPKFTKGCIITETKGKIFKNQQQRLMVIKNAESCIDFSKTPVDPPVWDRETWQEIWDQEVIRRSGEVKIKHELPLIFWILFLLGAINAVLALAEFGGIR